MVGLLLTPPLLFIMLPLGNNPFLANTFGVKDFRGVNIWSPYLSVDHFDRPLVTSPWAPILPLVFAMFAIKHYPGRAVPSILSDL